MTPCENTEGALSKPEEKSRPLPEGEEPEAERAADGTAADTASEADGKPSGAEPPYPERPPSEDPRWVIRTVWIWFGFASFSVVFIVVLLVLGALYD